MRVALVNPPFSKLVYGEEKSIKSITPCLGLFYMQAYCADIAEIEVFEGEFFASFEDLIAAIEAFGPEVLGVTTNTSTWPLCARLARASRARIKVAGGPYSAFRVEESLDCFDAVALGDGETSLRALLTTGSPAAAPGLAYRTSSGAIRRNPPAFLPPLDALPYPDHRAMQIGLYQASPHRELPEPFATMVTTRGCGFQCTFCLSATGGLNGGRYRERSVKNVVGEIRLLQDRFGVRSIQFWDDTFTMRKERTREICNALGQLGIVYVCITRTDKIDQETADLLAESGCRGVFFGVESGDPGVLEADHHKGVNNECVRRAFAACRVAGLSTTASFIFGSIEDTHASIEASVAFSMELGSDYVLYNVYTAHPGTTGYERAVAEGVIPAYTVDTDRWRGEPVGVPTVCRNLARNEILLLKAEAYLRYYRHRKPENYVELIETYEREIRSMVPTT
jgi:anaerobic magnesium-protoporphyrin IX monomethyl ester cyclase